MALRSNLFKGDAKLEAAAAVDAAHIRSGARGPHVGKIQRALNELAGALLQVDAVYGQRTAAAVLRYKQDRNIVNRSYQKQADDIVGKLTVLALDAELLRKESPSGGSPRIVGLHPAPEERHQRVALTSPASVTGGGNRGAKLGFADVKAPDIVPPPGLFRAMELLSGHVGTFDVVDGVGGTVRSWDSTVGVVFDPNEPSAHSGTMPITRSPHRFAARALGIGTTTIEARGPGGFLSFGDMIRLTVVASSDRLSWNPALAVRVDGRMHAEVFASNEFGTQELGVRLQSPTFWFTGTVDPDGSVNRSEFEVGILQTVVTTSFVALYESDDKAQSWQRRLMGPNGPSRDTADGSTFWYHADSPKAVAANGATKIESNDTPHTIIPWQTKNKRGSLVSTVGLDVFKTYLAVRNKRTAELTPLAVAEWTVNWGGQFEFRKNLTNLTTGARLVRSDTDMTGEDPPVTGGRSCVEQINKSWIGPAGGY